MLLQQSELVIVHIYPLSLGLLPSCPILALQVITEPCAAEKH